MNKARLKYGILLTISLLCAVLPTLAAGQDPLDANDEAIFNAHWMRQEYQPYTLSRQSYVLQSGDTTEMERLLCQADVLVCDSTYKAYRMQWRFSGLAWQGRHYLLSQWVASLKDFRVECETSPAGVLKAIDQAQTLREHIDASIDAFFAHLDRVPPLDERERLYVLGRQVEDWLLASVYQFYECYGLGYRLGQTVLVPDQIGWDGKTLPVTRYKKLESLQDGMATLLTATVPDTVLYTADSTRLQLEQTSAMMMHLASGWPVYSYEQREYGISGYKEGVLDEITLKYK